ncbi:N-acetyl-gamma-glutamyl-phosphate reductase [Nitrincola alkalilacustris]|uniref:N-acetyl-gamma-glutamyl-phosphate reductase n=1 Tax=Nitrincola alkalilacustris TaxID=1571224 RepID=UPI00124BF276|nr:N-acetyl-gamma-glutamyl-phosphate reductase [Nitrincola alkalilacustris]
MKKVFIDGETGTTGLQVRQRLQNHPDIDILSIDPAEKRDIEVKRRLMQAADVSVLCLPDDAAKESAKLAAEAGCRVLDASSAHRTANGWVYGLPELTSDQRQAIANAQFVSNPGCYPTGVILLLQPLIAANLLPKSAFYCINAVSGYSGGGNALIDRYENSTDQAPSFAAYGLDFAHKHLPEIQTWSGLSQKPVFIPSVGNFRQGMLIFIPIQTAAGISVEDLYNELVRSYQDETFVSVAPFNEIAAVSAPFITPHGLENSNRVELSVFGSPDRCTGLLVAKLDNLGKGASGAAVQNLNLMLGFHEGVGVDLQSV